MVKIKLIWIVTIAFDNVDTVDDYNIKDMKEINLCYRKRYEKKCVICDLLITESHICYRNMLRHISARG